MSTLLVDRRRCATTVILSISIAQRPFVGCSSESVFVHVRFIVILKGSWDDVSGHG